MNKSIYRLMLAVLLCMVGVSSASATIFISDIKYGVHDHEESTTKGYLTNNGYTVINVELNNNENKSGEAWVFLGYKTTTDPSKAITDIMIVSGGNSETYLSGYSEADGGITFAGDSRKWYRCPSEGSSADINRFNGGDYLTIYYTRDNCVANGGSPLTALSATTSKDLSDWTYSNLWKGGSISAYGSTNTGTTGKATYIIYQTHTHNFTYQQSTATQHIYGCAECGYVESTVDHTMTYKDNGDGTHSYWCATCGYVESTVDHTMAYTDNGNGTHTYYCTVCGYALIENHGEKYTAIDADHHLKSCPECGSETTDIHHFRGHDDNNGTTHTRVCYFCGYAASPESHNYDYFDNGDGTHIAYCPNCTHKVTVAHTLTYTDNGDGTHTAKCSLCKYVGSAENHTIAYTDNGDGTHTANCSICGHTESATHTIVYKYINDETHSEYCTVCDNVVNKLNHDFQITKNDYGTFYVVCPTCSYQNFASYIYGDINCDGKVDITDVALLVKVLKGEAAATPQCNAHSADDEINMKDLDVIREIVLGNMGITIKVSASEDFENAGDNEGDDVSKSADAKKGL